MPAIARNQLIRSCVADLNASEVVPAVPVALVPGVPLSVPVQSMGTPSEALKTALKKARDCRRSDVATESAAGAGVTTLGCSAMVRAGRRGGGGLPAPTGGVTGCNACPRQGKAP